MDGKGEDDEAMPFKFSELPDEDKKIYWEQINKRKLSEAKDKEASQN